jgi:hypothetical protein
VRSEASSLRHVGNRWSTLSSSSTMSSQSPRIGQNITPKTSPQIIQRGFTSSAAQSKPLPQKPLPRTPATLASPPESPKKTRKASHTPASIAHTEEDTEEELESTTDSEDSESTEQDPADRSDSTQQEAPQVLPAPHALENSGDLVVNRVMALSAALSQRTEEIRMIRQLAEQKVQETMERIKELESKAEGVEVL